MVIPHWKWGGECEYDAQLDDQQAHPNWRQIDVAINKLDSLSWEKPIAFIKCDANFHELEVLRGAMENLRKYMPALLIEVNPDPDDPSTTAFTTFELMRNLGYQAYLLRRNLLATQKNRRAQPKLLFPDAGTFTAN